MKRKSLWLALLLSTTAIISPSIAHADAATAVRVLGTVAAIAVNAIPGIGQVLSAVISTAILAGSGFLAAQLSAPVRGQMEARTRDADPHPVFRFVSGQVPQEGTMVFHHVAGRNYYVVYLLNSIPSESVDKIIIQGSTDLEIATEIGADLYDMTSLDNQTRATSVWQQDDLHIWVGKGDHTQCPQKWLDEIGPSGTLDPGVLKATDAWLGCTVAFVRFQGGGGEQKRLPAKTAQGVPPPLRFFGKWAKLYDPRRDSTSGVTGASGTHRIDDSSTWEYTASDGTEIGANPALQWLMLATHDFALGFDQEMIPISQVADAADACEVVVSQSAESTFYDFSPATSGTVPAFGGAASVGTFTGVSCTAGSEGGFALLSLPGDVAAQFTAGSYRIVLADGTVKTITVASTVYDGDDDVTTLRVSSPTSLSFTAQSVSFTEAASGAPPTRTWTMLSGEGDYVAVTQYSSAAGSVPALRLKGTFPALSKASAWFDMAEEAVDYETGLTVTVNPLAHGETGNTYFRTQVYQADADPSGSGDADAADFGMPPDAANIEELYDTELLQVGDAFDDAPEVTVTKRYLSIVRTGGPESGTSYDEIGDFTLTAGAVSVPRYRSDGMVSIEDRDFSLFDPVLAAMAGHLDTTDGLLGIRAGVWVAPTDTLTQPVSDDIDINGARDGGFDKVVAKYIARQKDFQETDGPGWTVRAGSRREPVHLALVRETGQAQRLEKIAALRAEPNRVVTAVWDGRESMRRVGERVSFALTGFARASSTYIIDSIGKVYEPVQLPDGSTGFRVETPMTLREDVQATYLFDTDDYVPVDFADLPAIAEPSLTAPTIAAVQSDYRTVDGESHARLKITVGHTDTLGEFRVEVKTTGGSYQYLTLQSTTATSAVVYLDPAVVGVTYTARARREDDFLGASDWVEADPVTIIATALDYASADYSAEYA